jgi:hypothetical protein
MDLSIRLAALEDLPEVLRLYLESGVDRRPWLNAS